MSFIVVVFLFILAFLVNKRIALLPGRLQTILEMLVGYVYSYVEETLGEKNAARRYFPLIASLFLFILAGNMIQFIPGIGSIGFFRPRRIHSASAFFEYGLKRYPRPRSNFVFRNRICRHLGAGGA